MDKEEINNIINRGFIYDELSDSLMIFNRNNKDKVDSSVRVLNLIIDMTKESGIANVEIRNVSDYLNVVGINPNILNRLENAEISIKKLSNGYIIYFMLKHDNKTERIPYNIITEGKPSILTQSF